MSLGCSAHQTLEAKPPKAQPEEDGLVPEERQREARGTQALSNGTGRCGAGRIRSNDGGGSVTVPSCCFWPGAMHKLVWGHVQSNARFRPVHCGSYIHILVGHILPFCSSSSSAAIITYGTVVDRERHTMQSFSMKSRSNHLCALLWTTRDQVTSRRRFSPDI